MTNAVIFAAGRGQRLGVSVPKALIEFEGLPIIAHQLNALSGQCEAAYIVCGYRADWLVRIVTELHNENIHRWPSLCFIFNPEFKLPQWRSIRCVTTAIPYDQPTLFIDGDILFRSSTVFNLKRKSATCAVLSSVVTKDSVIPVICGELITEFRRAVQGDFEWGNIACYTPDALRAMHAIVHREEQTHHFELINLLIQYGTQVQYSVEDIAEIDAPEDINAAREFLTTTLA